CKTLRKKSSKNPDGNDYCHLSPDNNDLALELSRNLPTLNNRYFTEGADKSVGSRFIMGSPLFIGRTSQSTTFCESPT
ncbi:MAG: hypothetical protein IJJ20_05015, partial [Thermoguttaceae bacterium]|nr:hypothetical protein [Thermoguttaceae bacterium]